MDLQPIFPPRPFFSVSGVCRLERAVVFNMMVDWAFLVDQVPALRKLKGDRLTVIHGEVAGERGK